MNDRVVRAAKAVIDRWDSPLWKDLPATGEYIAALRAAIAEAEAPTCSAIEIWPLVVQDMLDRDDTGRERYGRPLTANDGRDSLMDLYEELLDAAVYTRKIIFERDGR